MAIAHPLAVEPVDDGSRSVARPPRPPARGDRRADATRGGWPAAGPDGSQAGLRSPCRPPVVNSASRPPVLQATDRPRRDSSRAQPEVALPPRVNPAPSAPGGRHLARRPPITEGRVTPITSAPPPPPSSNTRGRRRGTGRHEQRARRKKKQKPICEHTKTNCRRAQPSVPGGAAAARPPPPRVAPSLARPPTSTHRHRTGRPHTHAASTGPSCTGPLHPLLAPVHRLNDQEHSSMHIQPPRVPTLPTRRTHPAAEMATNPATPRRGRDLPT